MDSEELQFHLSKYIENFERQIDLVKTMFVDEATNRPMSDFTLITWAMLNRSIANVQGFIDAIRQENFLLMPSILRLQLDSLMRLYAFDLVDEPHKLAEQIFTHGKKFSNITDRAGNSMNDKHLSNKVAEAYNSSLRTVYERTSGFIHFSTSYIHAMLQVASKHKEGEPLECDITLGISEFWKPDNADIILECVKCMRDITNILLANLKKWQDYDVAKNKRLA